MCVRARREFHAPAAAGSTAAVPVLPAPAAVGTFAAAAVLAALDPEDWQIAQDVDHAAERIVGRWRAAGRPERPFAVTVDLHATHIDLYVTDGLEPQAPVEHIALTPRRPFRTDLACTAVPRHAADPTPRPWFANGRPHTPVDSGPAPRERAARSAEQLAT